MKDINDLKLFSDLKAKGEAMKAAGSDRDENYDAVEDIYFMDATGTPTDEGVKTTISPTGRNAVVGMQRLLTAAEPIISVKRDDNRDTSNASKIEALLQTAWRVSCELAGNELQADAALAALLYSKVDISVVMTADLVKLAKGSSSKAAQKRIEKIAKRTPFIFQVRNPRNSYLLQDMLGMVAYYSEQETTIGEIKNVYGQEAQELQGADTLPATLCDYWDLTHHVIWEKSMSDPLLFVEHDLPFIPVAVATSEGSRLWKEEDRRLQPFLLSLHKSGIWQRQNLVLTTIFTKLAQFGSTPPLVVEQGNTDDHITIDNMGPMPIWYLGPGSRVAQANFTALDPNVYRALDITGQIAEQSTIYTQTLGAPLGASSPFSTVSLLGQAGRLPLTSPQKAVSKAIGDIMQIALGWLAEEKQAHELTKDIDFTQEYDVEVKVDVRMPQDLVKNAGVAAQMTGSGLVSKNWALENLMQITDPDKERRQIAQEQVYAAMFGQRLQQVMQMQQQPQQPAQGQPGQGQPQPGQGQPPQDMGAMGQPGMPGPDGAMNEPLPPEMAGQMGAGIDPQMMGGMDATNPAAPR